MIDPSGFKDHFSGDPESYRRFRPGYPADLFSYLARLCPERERAWDCGCGNGQASLGLAARFGAVDATDPSAKQIAEAAAHPRVAYTVAPAEASGLAPAATDLIVAAQAAHWFDFDAFHAEVRRVAKPAGVIALIGYRRMCVGPDIDPLTEYFQRTTLAPYWPPERAHVDAAYRTVPFPFQEIAPPAFAARTTWSLAHLLGYIGTWSALGRCRRETGTDPLAPLAEALRARWGGPATARPITWPIHMRLGRVFGHGANRSRA